MHIMKTTVLFFLLSLWLILPVSANTITPLPECGGYRLPPGRPSPEECPVRIRNWKAGDLPVVLFLNFGGAVITKGGDDPEHNTSWIPDYDEVIIPPFDAEAHIRAPLTESQQVIDAVTGWVRHFYSPFNVVVTSERPPAGTAYAMMMVGGTGDLITAYPGGMVGVSPFDCGNQDKRDVAFCFAGSLGSIADVVTTIVHEAGHGFGLAHIDNPAAIMNPYVTTDPDWGSGTVPDGSACDGSGSQVSMDVLSDNLGSRADVETPWVDFVNPGDGARVNLPVAVNLFTGDEDSLGVRVELFLDGQTLGEKTWPYFTWRVSSAEAGRHTLKAVVVDRAGNTSSTSITVNVDTECLANGSCSNGKAGVSEACKSETSCHLGLCVQNLSGDGSWCSAPCTYDTSACAPGMTCVPNKDATEYYCAEGLGPVTRKSRSLDSQIGCTTSPGSRPGFPAALMLFSLAGLLFSLRRKQM
ncbi:MAG: hypothetical protein CVU65_14735 [Deltaproteobacteria bacterium HGW-Deltaproteobacteria-22]|nr:MAG: hypothetical protein CVU65_14735 [Deltaproteobacteria bacterium HGW-Deltaproteobacteria-22]